MIVVHTPILAELKERNDPTLLLLRWWESWPSGPWPWLLGRQKRTLCRPQLTSRSRVQEWPERKKCQNKNYSVDLINHLLDFFKQRKIYTINSAASQTLKNKTEIFNSWLTSKNVSPAIFSSMASVGSGSFFSSSTDEVSTAWDSKTIRR